MLDTRKQKPKLKEMQDEQSPLTAWQSLPELVEYLARSQAKSFSRLSRIELEDIRIPGGCSPGRALVKLSWIDVQTESAIVDASPWISERALDLLPDFIAKGSQSPCKRGDVGLSTSCFQSLRAFDFDFHKNPKSTEHQLLYLSLALPCESPTW